MVHNDCVIIFPVVNVHLPEYMQSGIISLWNMRRHTDVTFTIGTSCITAHRLVLASQSEYFDCMLFGETIEGQPGAEIPLPDTPLEAFQLLLKYAYSGSLKMKNAQLEVHLSPIILCPTIAMRNVGLGGGRYFVRIGDRSNQLW